MELASTPPQPEPPGRPPPGELVVQNSRLRGARRGLTSPLTLIGRGPPCEVRLHAEGVQDLHCAVVYGPHGFLLRDLGGGSRVNGQEVVACALCHGDQIGVGPFLFRLEVTPGEGDLTPAALEGERDALRIQAAAVAAQQAGLTEEELRLQQRRTALDRQEEQLAAHLEERRRRLLELQEQLRQGRAALRAEREDFRREQEEGRQALAQGQAEAAAARGQAEKERRRLVELRKRLRRRWRRHWDAREADLKRREQRLAEAGASLRAEREQLARDRMRFNGEAELGRRQLREEWQQLGQAQLQWEECLHHEHQERGRRLRELEARAAAVAAGEQALARERGLWEQTRADLRDEAEG